MSNHPPREPLKEAKAIAAEHNMFVVDEGDTFLLYRKAVRPTFLGKRSSAAGLRTIVSRCATTK